MMTIKTLSADELVEKLDQHVATLGDADLLVQSEGAGSFVVLSEARYRALRALERRAYLAEDIPDEWFDRLGDAVHSDEARRLNAELT